MSDHPRHIWKFRSWEVGPEIKLQHWDCSCGAKKYEGEYLGTWLSGNDYTERNRREKAKLGS